MIGGQFHLICVCAGPLGRERLNAQCSMLPLGDKRRVMTDGFLLGMKRQLQVGFMLGCNIVENDQDIGFDEQNMPNKSLETQLGRIGGSGVADTVVEFGCGKRPQNCGLRHAGQRLTSLEPLGAFAELPPAVDQERVVLPSPLRMIPVVPDQPLPAAEEREVIGVRMNMPAAGVVGKFVHPLVADERSALENHERLISRPVGPRETIPMSSK